MNEEMLKQIDSLAEQFYLEVKQKKKFIPGKTRIRFAGDVYDSNEIKARLKAVLKDWITIGEFDLKFRQEFSKFLGVNNVVLTNSGSSANLLAISALCAKSFSKRLKKGDEIITPACTFPTTLNPILLNNLVPVFMDVDLGYYNINANKIKEVISEKTKAIFIPHTLGNPNEMDVITKVCKDNDLILIEDNCDALDSYYDEKITGSFGLAGTSSFYPAHHMSMGEGGAVYTNDNAFWRILISLRNWGRACYCDLNEKNPMGACKGRFNYKIKGVPYDHKYIYSNIGYNLKPLDIQPAVGLEQLKKLPMFTKKRKENFQAMFELFKQYEDYFILPKVLPKANPSWFSFPLTIKEKSGFTREDFTKHLENNLIETRVLFAGNILNHPAYEDIECRISSGLENSEKVFKGTMFMGVYPGIGSEELEYIETVVEDFFKVKK